MLNEPKVSLDLMGSSFSIVTRQPNDPPAVSSNSLMSPSSVTVKDASLPFHSPALGLGMDVGVGGKAVGVKVGGIKVGVDVGAICCDVSVGETGVGVNVGGTEVGLAATSVEALAHPISNNVAKTKLATYNNNFGVFIFLVPFSTFKNRFS